MALLSYVYFFITTILLSQSMVFTYVHRFAISVCKNKIQIQTRSRRQKMGGELLGPGVPHHNEHGTKNCRLFLTSICDGECRVTSKSRRHIIIKS